MMFCVVLFVWVGFFGCFFFFFGFSLSSNYRQLLTSRHLKMGVSNTHLKEWYLKPSLEQLRFHWDSGFPIAEDN